MTESETTETDQTEQSVNESQKEQMLKYLYWGGFIGLCLFGVFAAVGFYRSVMEIINIWITADFKPVFRMLFNLVIMLIALLCLSVLLRRPHVAVDESEDG